MEDNLILEGLLSMVTEMKEKLEAQVTPASREETLERFGAIEQALSRLHSNPAVPMEKLQTIQSQLDDVRKRMQGQQQHIEDTKRISLEIYRNFKIMVDTLNSYKTDKEEVAPCRSINGFTTRLLLGFVRDCLFFRQCWFSVPLPYG